MSKKDIERIDEFIKKDNSFYDDYADWKKEMLDELRVDHYENAEFELCHYIDSSVQKGIPSKLETRYMANFLMEFGKNYSHKYYSCSGEYHKLCDEHNSLVEKYNKLIALSKEILVKVDNHTKDGYKRSELPF